jgi:NADPH:quinone reductase and related Zn-dependent oxidoreductases
VSLFYFRCNAKPNQTLFIIGANRGNGLAAIQVGKAYGLTVFASVGCPVGVSKAYEFGADYVVDHT